MVWISTISSTFIDAENLRVGDFETLKRWIGCVILIRGCEDQGCLHLSPIWWWQKGEEEYFEDCSMKILDDLAWFNGKFVYCNNSHFWITIHPRNFTIHFTIHLYYSFFPKFSWNLIFVSWPRVINHFYGKLKVWHSSDHFRESY